MGWTFILLLALCTVIHGRVKVTFRLVEFGNTGQIELVGFDLCFDVFKGNYDMTSCPHGKFQIRPPNASNDDHSYPSSLASNLDNPIVLTIDSWSTGFRFKIEVWANGEANRYKLFRNYKCIPDRTSALAIEDTVNLTTVGTPLFIVAVKVYCDVHYYGTSSGCSTYCLARDNCEGHYDCEDTTGARVCHCGWEGSYCNIE
eukprot:XP_011663511.1 PREDICTED: neurogenic locus protein delta-like [Strongylocentrotus purpuratus]